MNQLAEEKVDVKKVFLKKGACSHTFFYLLNQEFGHTNNLEEGASDPLAGGIIQKGHQCGMLWGSALAVGAEAYRRCEDPDKATGLAIAATRDFTESFVKRTNTLNCRAITQTDFSSAWQFIRYMLFRTKRCFQLAEDWAPEAIQSAREGLSRPVEEIPSGALSCATEVVRKMGASEEQMAMVAGFAGGLGLTGHACGALGAAIWMNSVRWSEENPGKRPYGNPKAKITLQKFYDITNFEMLCPKISGRQFKTINEHTDFVKNGGCEELIELLSLS